jgi:hypothetical protein
MPRPIFAAILLPCPAPAPFNNRGYFYLNPPTPTRANTRKNITAFSHYVFAFPPCAPQAFWQPSVILPPPTLLLFYYVTFFADTPATHIKKRATIKQPQPTANTVRVATQVVNAVFPTHITTAKTPHCQPHRQESVCKYSASSAFANAHLPLSAHAQHNNWDFSETQGIM